MSPGQATSQSWRARARRVRGTSPRPPERHQLVLLRASTNRRGAISVGSRARGNIRAVTEPVISMASNPPVACREGEHWSGDCSVHRPRGRVVAASRAGGRFIERQPVARAVIVGAPGIGKTRLVTELISSSGTERLTTLHGTCRALDQSRAFAPIVEAAKTGTAAPHSELASLLAPSAPEVSHADCRRFLRPSGSRRSTVSRRRSPRIRSAGRSSSSSRISNGPTLRRSVCCIGLPPPPGTFGS